MEHADTYWIVTGEAGLPRGAFGKDFAKLGMHSDKNILGCACTTDLVLA